MIVAIPDGLEIYNSYNRKIFIKSSIRLLGLLKLKEKTFSLGNSSIDFYWHIDPPTNANLTTVQTIAKSDCADSRQETCTKKDVSVGNNVGIFLNAINKGDVEVKLKVHINYPEMFKNKKSDFANSEKIFIDKKLDMDINQFYNDNSNLALYLVPFDVVHQLKTNEDPNVIICLILVLEIYLVTRK